jgi:DNA-binding NtrC family response regulator
MQDRFSTQEHNTTVVPVPSSARAGARLVVIEGPDAGASLVVTRARHTVGRHPTNDLVLTDPAVSLVHLEVQRPAPELLVVRDAQTTNGTWLGPNRVVEARLAPGAVLKVGSTLLRVEAHDHTTPAAASGSERFEGLVGQSVEMRELFEVLERVAPKNLSVLVEGETGTGKEEVARAIHLRSPRKKEPFVVLDAAAIPPTLAESMLFGHERGAFTGAESRHLGAFERATGGTIFIDEVGELPLPMQPKLLRVLERREVVRVGGRDPLTVNVRVIAATHRDLRKEVEAGRFRDDLYFRLAQVRLLVPALRARPDDIPLLARSFLDCSGEPDAPSVSIAEEAIAELLQRPWPGNVRELKNVMLRAAALCEAGVIGKSDIGSGGFGFHGLREEGELDISGAFSDAKARAIDRFERAYLEALMRRSRGNLSKASRDSGIARNHLRDLLRKRGLYEPVTD